MTRPVFPSKTLVKKYERVDEIPLVSLRVLNIDREFFRFADKPLIYISQTHEKEVK